MSPWRHWGSSFLSAQLKIHAFRKLQVLWGKLATIFTHVPLFRRCWLVFTWEFWANCKWSKVPFCFICALCTNGDAAQKMQRNQNSQALGGTWGHFWSTAWNFAKFPLDTIDFVHDVISLCIWGCKWSPNPQTVCLSTSTTEPHTFAIPFGIVLLLSQNSLVFNVVLVSFTMGPWSLLLLVHGSYGSTINCKQQNVNLMSPFLDSGRNSISMASKNQWNHPKSVSIPPIFLQFLEPRNLSYITLLVTYC